MKLIIYLFIYIIIILYGCIVYQIIFF